MKSDGLILRNAVAICEMSKTCWQKGKLLMKDDSENHSKDQQFLLERWLNVISISVRDQSRLHRFGKKVSPEIFRGFVLIAGGIWKGDIMISDIEELEKLDAQEKNPRRINAKEVLISQKKR